MAMAHHPVIQKEVDELLATYATEPLTSSVDFISNACVVPKLTGGLQPRLKQFNYYTCTPTFKMQVGHLDPNNDLINLTLKMLIYINLSDLLT